MKKVLVIEDNKCSRRLYERFLGLEGYEVRSAADGRTGLELLKSWKPDLLVLDYMLPDMTGEDICRVLRETPELKSVLILMITAHTYKASDEHCMKMGADGYLEKNFKPEQLKVYVEALLRKGKPSEK
ncbi:MAG TPA: response regulator transcription factor [Elusimicrobiota bacterium]|nr:response regulator transcription factor [Elusimicrobiota bacterium]